MSGNGNTREWSREVSERNEGQVEFSSTKSPESRDMALFSGVHGIDATGRNRLRADARSIWSRWDGLTVDFAIGVVGGVLLGMLWKGWIFGGGDGDDDEDEEDSFESDFVVDEQDDTEEEIERETHRRKKRLERLHQEWLWHAE